MAVEIIPKPKGRKKIKVSLIAIGYYLSVSLFIGVLLAYFSFYLFENNLNKRLGELSNLIAQKETREAKDLENRIFDFKDKLEDFAKLLEARKKSSQFFAFFGPLSHKRAFFSRLDLDIGGSKAELRGQTESLKTFREQMLIFAQENLIKETDLSALSIERGADNKGGVTFGLNLLLNPQIFK